MKAFLGCGKGHIRCYPLPTTLLFGYRAVYRYLREFCISNQLSYPISLSSSNNSDAMCSAPLTQSPCNPQINLPRGFISLSEKKAFLLPRPCSNYLYVCHDKQQTAVQRDTYTGLHVSTIPTPGTVDSHYVIRSHKQAHA
jgi:hypothetical protein